MTITNIIEIAPNFIDGEMPRYIIDLRVGCAAIRDTLHEKFDATKRELSAEVEDVVEYLQGEIIRFEWTLNQDLLQDMEDKCDYLNEVEMLHYDRLYFNRTHALLF
jgi:hypothetical protein